jgi:hypothetical protein
VKIFGCFLLVVPVAVVNNLWNRAFGIEKPKRFWPFIMSDFPLISLVFLMGYALKAGW